MGVRVGLLDRNKGGTLGVETNIYIYIYMNERILRMLLSTPCQNFTYLLRVPSKRSFLDKHTIFSILDKELHRLQCGDDSI